jgi:hypothetical protein
MNLFARKYLCKSNEHCVWNWKLWKGFNLDQLVLFYKMITSAFFKYIFLVDLYTQRALGMLGMQWDVTFLSS